MRNAALIRISFGMLFVLAGVAGLTALGHGLPKTRPGLVHDFQAVFFASHWEQVVEIVQIAAGAFVVANRYVPLAMLVLAGVIVNISFYDMTIAHAGVPFACLMCFVWVLVAWPHRPALAVFLRAKPAP